MKNWILRNHELLAYILRFMIIVGVYRETKSIFVVFTVAFFMIDNYFLNKKYIFLEEILKDIYRIIGEIPFPKINSKN